MGGALIFCRLHPFRSHGRVKLATGLVSYLILPFIWTFMFPIRKSFLYEPFFRIADSWFYAGYLLYFIFAMLIIFWSFSLNVKQALFYASAAYIIQHLRYGCMELLSWLLFDGDRSSLLANTISLLLALLLFAYTNFSLRKIVRKDEMNMVNNKQISLFVFSVLVMINAWNMYIFGHGMGNLGSIFYLVVVCLLLLIIQFGMLERRKLLSDKQIMESLLVDVNRQRQNSTQNIDLLNRKFHDLKYQLAAMREMNHEQRDESLNDLEKAIGLYDKNFNTGNTTLDTILTEKSFLCDRLEIDFSCIIDGACLDFMKPVDVYSLLGNALDNAIEAVEREKSSEKKVITLNMARRADLVSLCLINVCTGELHFENGLPLTQKDNRDEHGFGMKNIVYTVEKYRGNFRMSQKDGLFRIDILLPVS